MNFKLNKQYPLYSLSAFAKPYLSVVIGALVAMVLASAALLAMPYAMGHVFDQGLSRSLHFARHDAFLSFAAVSFFAALFSAGRFYLVSWLGERIIADLRKYTFTRVLRLDMHQLETLKTGEVLSRLTTDTTLVQQVLSTGFSMALRNLIQSVGAMVMLWYTSWYLTTVFLVMVPLLLVPLWGMMKKQRSLSRSNQDRIADIGAYAGEVLQAMSVTKAFTHEAYDQKAYGHIVDLSCKTSMKRVRVRSLLTVFVMLMLVGSLLTVFWVGTTLMVASPPVITAGQLAQFFLYAALLVAGVMAVTEVWGDVVRASASSERILEICAMKPTITSPRNHHLGQVIKGSITFDSVSFSYPSRPNRLVLDGFSCDIKPGNTIALVGESGAGKSTVLQLLMRFYGLSSGAICIDGVPIENYDLHHLRQAMSLVPQDIIVFSGSIFENIAYGDPEAPKSQVLQAAKLALVDDFVSNLPAGYDTLVGERGMRLSGGQRQRIAIARAFLRNAPILLLDEATSHLDSHNEYALQVVVDKLRASRTTIVIAHRLATVQKADELLFLEKGKIVARGSHRELVKANSQYAKMASLQLLD
ncbi:MAG: ABC transporter transmembrane domain-containing protein [Pseudomonadota bacterium]|nr:ABC transporter transmembrane domain-containing protein [Pseudomonadota bacterium]